MEIYGLSMTDGHIRYVGRAMYGAEARFLSHWYDTTVRSSMTPVHKWMRKHGVDGVLLTVLETIDEETYLNDREIYWIAELDTYLPESANGGLNCTRGGEGSAGYKHTDETRALMSMQRMGNKIRLGIPLSIEHRKAVSNARTGKVASSETRRKISEANTGRVVSEETRRKLSRVPSEETRRRISASLLGHQVSEEARIKISKSWETRVVSDETRRKLSAFQKDRVHGPFNEKAKANMSAGQHRRWHENRGIKKKGCVHCE